MNNKLGKNFYMIFIASVLVSCSTAIYGAVLFYSLWYHSGSTLISSLIYMPMYIVTTFLSPMIGYHVDKYDKKKIGLFSIILSTILVSSLLILHNIFLITIIYFLLVFLEYYFIIDYKVTVKIIVSKDNLLRANTLYVAGEGASNLVGFLIGSYIYLFISNNVFVIFLILLYISACISWFSAKIKIKSNNPINTNKKTKKKYMDVFNFLSRNRHIIHIIILYDIIAATIITIDAPAYISFCFKYLKMTTIIYGLYRGLVSGISVIAPLIIYKYIKSKNVTKYATKSLLGVGSITVLITSIPFLIYKNIYQQILFILFVSINTYPITLEYSSFSTIFQQIVPTNILGRFYSLRSIVRGTIGMTFLLFGGFLTDTLGPIPILYASGIGLILVSFFIKKCLKDGVYLTP